MGQIVIPCQFSDAM
ncbi:MAG: hypothetical protein ACKPGR_27665, partial [Dolichospermum sp.]